ncbi:MAG: hypothetical protein Q8W49_11065 [Candidatus Palauibacterales bacterium]|nr:hypothetical protein [Candidatus Palauibacterales bacterium]MDP2584873.1 hypothetical protein [Candidatus Palauibacterales bacterium]
MIVFHGCLFDATRIAEEGQIASRLYFEVVGTDAGPEGTCCLDVRQSEKLPYGEGEVRVGPPEGASCPEDRSVLARRAAEYYRMVAADLREETPETGCTRERARDVIVSRTWRTPLDPT